MNTPSVELSLLILLVIVVSGPIVAERFRIPGLIGLIAGGMIVGPFVLEWVTFDSLLKELGDVGLLYLMFLAGLSFNLKAFFRDKKIAMFYGVLGFVLPFSLSVWVALSVSELGILAAALIGAMWASNTLVAYPEVLAAGLQNNRAVSAAVSAGVVADLMSLTVLAIASSTAAIDVEGDAVARAAAEPTTVPVYVAVPILIAFCIWLLPKVADWFFVRVGHSRAQRFVFTLAGMAAGAYVATLGGIEGLIGAFLAGLGMNRLVPARSGLMDRLDFVGSTLFIPAFLVSIGLSINPSVLFDRDTVVLALLFTGLVVAGKTAAAVVTGWVFKVSGVEIGMMSALSFGQAASTLAIAQVGISLGFFGQDVVNAAVLTIVVTAFITSYGTRFFARRVEHPPDPEVALGETVLVDIRPLGSDLESLMQVAGAIARPDDGLVIPYAVPNPGQKETADLLIEGAVAAAAVHGHDSSGQVRIDDTFAGGTVKVVEEVHASLLLLAWEGPSFPMDFVFGNEIDRIGLDSSIPTAAVRTVGPWERVVVTTGSFDSEWQAEDVELAVRIGRRLARQSDTELVVASDHPDAVRTRLTIGEGVAVVPVAELREDRASALQLADMLIMPAHAFGRSRAVGQRRIAKRLGDVSLMVVAGPRRLTVSGIARRSTFRSFVDPATGSTPSRR